MLASSANALEGYRTGVFRDGSVIVDERVEIAVADGVVRETGEPQRHGQGRRAPPAERRRGSETFENHVQTSAITPQIKANCHACHTQAKAHDLVFSRFRE